MSQNDNTRYHALYYLAESMPPRQVADMVGISYSTALRYKKEYDDALEANTIKELLDFPAAVLEEFAQMIKADAPVTIDGETQAIVDGVKGMQVLQDDFQLTATLLSRRVRTLVMSVETPDDLLTLTECLAKLQNAFFNSNTVQIAVQQNNVGSAPDQRKNYGAFLNDRPKNI